MFAKHKKCLLFYNTKLLKYTLTAAITCVWRSYKSVQYIQNKLIILHTVIAPLQALCIICMPLTIIKPFMLIIYVLSPLGLLPLKTIFLNPLKKKSWFDLTFFIPRVFCWSSHKIPPQYFVIFCDQVLTIESCSEILICHLKEKFSYLISHLLLWHLPFLIHQCQHDATGGRGRSPWRWTTSQSCEWLQFFPWENSECFLRTSFM